MALKAPIEALWDLVKGSFVLKTQGTRTSSTTCSRTIGCLGEEHQELGKKCDTRPSILRGLVGR